VVKALVGYPTLAFACFKAASRSLSASVLVSKGRVLLEERSYLAQGQ
jgi:hypothetical protein